MRAPSLPSLLVSHWSLAPFPWLPVTACGAVYVWAARRARGWPALRMVSFLAGLAALLLALASGLGAFDDRLLSVHMVQHLLLLLVAPLLLLGGRPLVLTLRTLPPRRRRRLVEVMAATRPGVRPLPCLALFYLVVVGTHLPGFYDAAVRHPAVHLLEHALYLSAGLVVWWPILDGDPVAAHRLGGLARLGYLLAAMPPMAIIGAWLNRALSVVYPAYGLPAHALGVSAVTDQQQAGAIMWVAGNMLMVVVGLWLATAAMIAEERRAQSQERRVQSQERPASAREAPGVLAAAAGRPTVTP